MPRLVLSIEYDGSAFEGWQSQPHGRTVQDALQAAVAAIAGHEVALSCAGRTDTGVHATVQIAHFDTDTVRPLSAWVRGVNAHLPGTVSVRWAQEVDETFHARFSAYARRYRYVLLNRPVRPAILAGKVGWHHAPLSLPRMQDAAHLLVGEHDFSAFRAAQCQAKSPVRILTMAAVRRTGDLIMFDFEANGFLHHMIRNLVGALIFIGKGEAESDWMGELLQMKDRRLAPPTFSPAGLYLCGVSYPDRWHLPGEGRIIGTPAIVL
ncbi:tRNA pseudouridine(38-40) synthase TruA [Uliginosibacterium sp. H3]|uniref:tRNA pseudouridine synthase A n=1 Tax=Uliginosibacterium silvisoli TaxID=3114758 RepID=A0ABU6K8L3_9RHOO|nr:tRNA pseudouridine(38-40) synthase TruA [Uliginosibacterium sp. H3]